MTDTHSEPASYLPSDDELYAEIDSQAANIMAVPTANTIEGGADFLAKFSAPRTMSTLAPEDREIVLERLKGVPPVLRAQRESELVQELIAEKVYALRVKQGPGPNANALTRERWMLARQASELEQQQDAIIAELAEVLRYDAETGAPVLRFPLDASERKAREAELHRLNTISTNIRNGTEGRERIAKARERALEEAKAHLREIHIASEAKRRAEAQVINERIEKLAEGQAKRFRNSL